MMSLFPPLLSPPLQRLCLKTLLSSINASSVSAVKRGAFETTTLPVVSGVSGMEIFALLPPQTTDRTLPHAVVHAINKRAVSSACARLLEVLAMPASPATTISTAYPYTSVSLHLSQRSSVASPVRPCQISTASEVVFPRCNAMANTLAMCASTSDGPALPLPTRTTLPAQNAYVNL